MLLLTVLLLLLAHTITGLASTVETPTQSNLIQDSAPTYQHRDPASGQLLNCAQCAPGTHMAAHCTATSDTVCVPCAKYHYTEFWNYLSRCLYCNAFCEGLGNREVERECSPTNNRVCRCKQGFYLDQDFCVQHSVCDLGYGVKTNGTATTDTVCEMCGDGYFSDNSSATESCVKHKECASSGQAVLLRGSSSHDAVCGSCMDRDGGRVKMLRTFLPAFFALHRWRAGKMRAFISRYAQMAGEKNVSLPNQRGPLLDNIRARLTKAPEEQLKRIPEILRTSKAKLNSLADRLEKRLREIEQNAPHCG